MENGRQKETSGADIHELPASPEQGDGNAHERAWRYKNLFQFTDIALTPESVRCSLTVAALRPLPLKFR